MIINILCLVKKVKVKDDDLLMSWFIYMVGFEISMRLFISLRFGNDDINELNE